MVPAIFWRAFSRDPVGSPPPQSQASWQPPSFCPRAGQLIPASASRAIPYLDYSPGPGPLAHNLHQIGIRTIVLQLAGQFKEVEDRIAGLFARRRRHHAVLLVVGLLDRAAPLGFGNGLGHRIGHVVGIQQRHPLHMASGAADGLDQRALGPQETFLIRIEDRHQAHLRQVQTLPQQSSPPPARRIPPAAGPG